MFRLLTCALGGESYLTFIGNEFGHPEWLDFPRVGNGDSYHYARRQWNLVKDDLLRFKQLKEFEKAVFAVDKKYNFLSSAPVRCFHIKKYNSFQVIDRWMKWFLFVNNLLSFWK